MEWVAIYSQTGSEIKAISDRTGLIPSLLVTNNFKKTNPIVLTWIKENNIPVYCLPFNPTLNNYRLLISIILLHTTGDRIITLNGFLRIIPEEVCRVFRGQLYNGHPGLITYYPNLKGKDPQLRAYELGYSQIGSVVHEVTAEVDEGKVLFSKETSIYEGAELAEYYLKLKETSLDTWVEFFASKQTK